MARQTPTQPTPAPFKPGFKVIIAGGSVAGLTLAHAFSAAGIDYELLEARGDIAPQVGASIVLLPNGLRVMDQLGCYEDLEEAMEPLQTAYAWTDVGEFVGKTDGPELAQTRMGYPCAFLARQRVLQILYDRLDERDKKKIHLNKRVERIEQDWQGCVVKCADGSEFRGDIVLGADGVHSKVRHEMRRFADEDGHPELMAKDRKAMYAEYSCVFGISLGVKGSSGGIGHRSHGKDCSTLCFVGKNERVFWFFIKKMDKRYYEGSIPRFTRADIDSHLQPHKNMMLNESLTVGECWDKVSSVSFVALEEAVYDNWTYGRVACVGDSIHKMTPNMGQGGNSAIESATVLANNIKRMLETNDKPDHYTVTQALLDYQVTRRTRTHAITNAANELTRLEAMATLPHKILALYIQPHLGDVIADLTGDTVIGAHRLEYLPPPPRSLKGHMPFDRRSGITNKENRIYRALWALPLLMLSYWASSTFGASRVALTPMLSSAAKTMWVGSIPMAQSFTGFAPFDNVLRAFVAFFTPFIANTNPASTLQSIAFAADLIPLQAVWMIESIRRSNFLTVTSMLPLVFTMAYQIKGIAVVAPIFYFLHYMQAPMENLAAIDQRLCNMHYVKTVLPALFFGYVIPTVAMYLPQLPIQTREQINGLWQFFPLLVAGFHWIFANLFVSNTTAVDRMTRPEADLPYLRSIYAITAAASASVYLYLWVFAPFPMKEIFFSGIREPTEIASIFDGAASMLRLDQIFCFGATFFWIILGFKDMKEAERTNTDLLKVAGIVGGISVALGPGAGLIGAWAWREKILTKKLLFRD